MIRRFHPLRVQRWALSDFNPWLAWLPGAAQFVKENRQALPADNALRRAEASLVDLASATLEYQRALRDAFTEALFFHVYGNLFSLYIADREPAPAAQPTDPRELPIVKEALASIDKGGYPEAFARVGFLVTRRGDVPLSRLEAGQQMVEGLQGVPARRAARANAPRRGRAGNHRDLRAGQGDRHPARAAAASARTASGCSRCSSGWRTMRASGATASRRSSARCSSAFAARSAGRRAVKDAAAVH